MKSQFADLFFGLQNRIVVEGVSTAVPWRMKWSSFLLEELGDISDMVE